MSTCPGKVYLVGAGPGDIGLLTVKGLKCLRKAEVVVYDFHLNAQILNYIRDEAELIYAGKRGGRHEMTQDEINEVLVQKAKEGKLICRLKGGDPFVFGRGGEEAEVLAGHGIEFEIVPGVSSSVAAPAYAGIPLTHRLYSSSFAVIPGYEDTTKEESAIDWTRLATGVGTLVVLMAVKNLNMLVERLIANGRSPDTPVAVVRWGTRPDQKTVVSTLSGIVAEVHANEIKPPAVVVIGDVVRLRERLKWYENKPMFGHRVLVTRENAGGFELLAELGAEILEFPTIEIAPPESWDELDAAISRVESYHWIIFTSANGVRYFLRRLSELDRDIRDLRGIRICAIGPKTAAEVRRAGMKVDLVPEEFHAEGLVNAFRNPGGDLRGLRLLLPRAEVAREVFPKKVKEMGGEIDIPVAYRAVKPETYGRRLKRFLREGKITIATFTSAATFTNFCDIVGSEAGELLRDVKIAAIGPVTAGAIEAAGLAVHIMPDEATIEAMAAEILKHAGRKA